MNAAIIFAGGTGQRMKNTAKPKQFLELYGKPIIIYTLEIFEKHPDIDMIIVPCVKGWEDYLQNLIAFVMDEEKVKNCLSLPLNEISIYLENNMS